MRLPVTLPNRTMLLSYALFAFSVIFLLLTLYFTSNIKVIENWKLSIPGEPIHAGDEVVLISSYKKTRNVDGQARRYIECKNHDGLFIRYPLSEANADRKAGNAGTGIPVKVPYNIPDLPAECFFSITISYPVLPFKPTVEKQQTQHFRLLPANSSPRTQTNPVPGPALTQGLLVSPFL